MMRLLRPTHSGIFWRSFRLHSAHYARETIAKICSLWLALATAIISQTGSLIIAVELPDRCHSGRSVSL